MSQVIETFRRYAQLIAPMVEPKPPTDFGGEDANTLRIERGLIYGNAVLDPNRLELNAVERLIEIANSPRLAGLRVVDAAGHQRPVYRDLLAYGWLQSFALQYETLPRDQFGRWEEALRRWCDLLESELTDITWPPSALPASRGEIAVKAAWTGLTLFVAGKVFIRDAWTDLAADTFGRFAKRQLDSGALLESTAADNIETLGYHELAALHAIASYAVQAEDRAAAAIVSRATEFHAAQTQADHSTGQPWALFAFVWNERTRSIADQMLHAVQSQTDSVSLMLLADALYCLKLFLK